MADDYLIATARLPLDSAPQPIEAPARTVLLDTSDIAQAQQVLSDSFSRVRIASISHEAPTHTRVLRDTVGSFQVSELTFGYDVSYHMDPTDKVALFRVHSGAIRTGANSPDAMGFGPGSVGTAALNPGQSSRGHVHHARYQATFLERTLFGRVAAPAAHRDAEPVALTGQVPVSRAAARHMADAFDHVARVALNAQAISTDTILLSSAIEQHLATTMLAVFPSTALLEPTIEDRHDSTPVLLRRAISYIDDNADRDITLTDIAAAVYVTPRAVQYMFRKHRDCTPTEYLRRVRLEYAHFDLIAGNRMSTTVGRVAAKWGFGHLGRFAAYYRLQFGVSPHQTLRR